MSFNLEKYLVENNLTVISKKREALKEEEAPEPQAADVAAAEKQFKDPIRDRLIKFSQNKIKPLLAKLKAGEIGVTDYKAQLAQAAEDWRDEHGQPLNMDINSVFQKLKSYKKVE